MTKQATPNETTIPADLIAALNASAIGRQHNPYQSTEDAWLDHLNYLRSMAFSPEHGEALVAREKDLRALGEEYYAQGYRVQRLERREIWRGFTVPEEALEIELEHAGYRAGCECHRLVYVIKIS
jgi:hypothetical protein